MADFGVGAIIHSGARIVSAWRAHSQIREARAPVRTRRGASGAGMRGVHKASKMVMTIRGALQRGQKRRNRYDVGDVEGMCRRRQEATACTRPGKRATAKRASGTIVASNAGQKIVAGPAHRAAKMDPDCRAKRQLRKAVEAEFGAERSTVSRVSNIDKARRAWDQGRIRPEFGLLEAKRTVAAPFVPAVCGGNTASLNWKDVWNQTGL